MSVTDVEFELDLRVLEGVLEKRIGRDGRTRYRKRVSQKQSTESDKHE
jgi:hypothetical protein